MPLEAVGLPVEAMRVLWRLRVLLEVMIGIFEPKRLLVKAMRVFVKSVKMHVHKYACRCKESACINCESAEAVRVFTGVLKYQWRSCERSRSHESASK